MKTERLIPFLVLAIISCTTVKQNSSTQQPETSGNKPVKGELSSENALRKEPSVITEKYWKLVEVAGKPARSAAQAREAHFILKDGRVSGNGGCNAFGGSYTLADGNKLTFSAIASTRMACMEPNTEDDFFRALAAVDHYSITGDTLSLSSAEGVLLAKLAVVYSK